MYLWTAFVFLIGMTDCEVLLRDSLLSRGISSFALHLSSPRHLHIDRSPRTTPYSNHYHLSNGRQSFCVRGTTQMFWIVGRWRVHSHYYQSDVIKMSQPQPVVVMGSTRWKSSSRRARQLETLEPLNRTALTELGPTSREKLWEKRFPELGI